MKKKYFTLLFCMLAVCYNVYAQDYSMDDDQLPIYGHWSTAINDKSNYIIFNFNEAEMQVVYYSNGKKIRKGSAEVWYDDGVVTFADDEADYTINNDTLQITINNQKYKAIRMNEKDVPPNNDDFNDESDKSWPKQGLVWFYEWWDDLWNGKSED